MLSRKINLVFYAARENYGDYISPYIVHKLSGLPIRQKDVSYLQKSWKTLLLELLMHRACNVRLSHKFLPFERTYVCVGSILGQGNANSHYWGSGYLKDTNVALTGTVYAVRGYLSKEIVLANKNKSLKIVGNLPVGDPALLLPLFIPTAKKKHKLGIVPHSMDYNFFKDNYGDAFFVIDLFTSDVVRVTQEITSCERILSSSLHGLIVAHAYNIPALWIEPTELIKGSNGFKFKDYFSSIGISYDPFRNVDDLLCCWSNIDRLFSENINNSLPQVELSIIRNNLLRVAPFPLLKEYRII